MLASVGITSAPHPEICYTLNIRISRSQGVMISSNSMILVFLDRAVEVDEFVAEDAAHRRHCLECIDRLEQM